MGWFSGTPSKAEQDRQTQRSLGFTGWIASDGKPVASRTDSKGRALGFGDKGWSGKGTKDEERAKKAGGGRKKGGWW